VRFDVSLPVARRFFLPRYAGGRLHEPGASRYVLDALTPRSVFLDVGANLGYFSMLAAGAAHAVFAVEPQERMAALVRANAELNGYANVHVVGAAAGAAPGFVTMPAEGRPGTAVDSVADGFRVPMIRLDDYFATDVAPDVVKIDVEGCELAVLRGATALLARGPHLVIELHRTMADFGARPVDIFEILSDSGYTLKAGAHRSHVLDLTDVGRASLEERFNNTMVFCEPRGAQARAAPRDEESEREV